MLPEIRRHVAEAEATRGIAVAALEVEPGPRQLQPGRGGLGVVERAAWWPAQDVIAVHQQAVGGCPGIRQAGQDPPPQCPGPARAPLLAADLGPRAPPRGPCRCPL